MKSKTRHLGLADSTTIELGAVASRIDTVFGYGMNCITGAVISHQPCVNGVATLAPQNTATDDLQVTVVKDSQSYSSFLSTAVTATASGLSWSGSVAVSYAASQTSSDTYMSYVAFRVLRSQTIYMDTTKATISDDALKVITSDPVNGPAKFVAIYGTHCAIGVAYGGSFVGRLRFETSSASSKETIAASMSASANAFGVSGSINAQFNSEMASITTSYYLSSDSSIVGATTSSFDRSNPDGMVAAAQNIALVADPVRKVNGNAIAFVCMTWDQFPQIQAALDSINQPQAFSFASAQGNIAQLSAEYSSLGYIIGTCVSMIKSGAYVLPSYGATLAKILNAASTGQAAIQSLTIEQIGQLTPAQLAHYLISSQMNPLLNAIAHSQVLINAAWYLDAAFVNPGWFSATFSAPLSPNETFVVTVDHHEYQGDLFFHVGQDGQGIYLTTHWQWHNGGGDFYGQRVDLGTPTFPTGVSSAQWTGANWNQINANAIDFNPSTLFGRSL